VKIAARQITGFLQRPDPSVISVLIYGPDQGLVRERAEQLSTAACANPDDPFNSVLLSADTIKTDAARLMDEANALSLSQERRLVQIRDATDSLGATFKAFLETYDGNALVIVESGDLSPRSSLRKLYEKADSAAAVPCYSDDSRTLREVIGETLGAHDISATPDAMAFLIDNLGANRLATRSELEKLVLYKGGPGDVSLDDALAAIGDSAITSLEDIAMAAASGDMAALEHALMRARALGEPSVRILRAAGRHLERLHLARGLVDSGQSPDHAMKALRPPVFFRIADGFRAQMRRWPRKRLAAALEALLQAELDCKTSGCPDVAVSERALMRITRMASSTP
jgi:DNA polymerase III subunit delta